MQKLRLSLKLAFAALLITLLAAIPACNRQNINREASTDDDVFVVAVINNTGSDIYGIHFEFYIDGRPVGGGDDVVVLFDGSRFEVGELVRCNIHARAFPENAYLSLFEIEINVFLVGDETRFAGRISPDVQFGSVFFVSLTGNSYDGFSLAESDVP